MMKTAKRYLFLTLLLFLALWSKAGISAYEGQMRSAVDSLEIADSETDYTVLANEFEAISKSNPNVWLPKYYEAACYIFITLIEDIELNENAVKDYQKEAYHILDKLLEDYPDDDEIHALLGLYYVSQVVHGPMYKMLFSYWKFKSATNQSLEINPNNPRAKYLLLASEMGKAEEFDKDLTPYCIRANQLQDEWDDYKPGSELHPAWGEKDLAKLLAKCE